VVTLRETFYESDILLTPYSADETIDAEALGAFNPEAIIPTPRCSHEIDTGALILTAWRSDGATRAPSASCSRARPASWWRSAPATLSKPSWRPMARVRCARNPRQGCGDERRIGGGTSKIAICADGKVVDLTAVDVGRALVVTDDKGRVTGWKKRGASSLPSLESS